MNDPKENDSEQELIVYRSFLQSLDNELFISHVQQVQHALQESNKQPLGMDVVAPKGISTPLNSSHHLLQLFSSDPFDDGLDEVLLNVGTNIENKEKESDDQGGLTDEDTIGEVHEFGDYATYFHNKHLKQQKADEQYVLWDKRRLGENGNRTPIFNGCVIHVNGHTIPSINEIHRLVISYGGKFISYLTNKGAATHIICDRLTPRKRIEYRNYKVVRAQWIVDSVAQDKLLDWQDYRLIEEVEYGQKRLNFEADVEESLDDELPLLTQAENDINAPQGLSNNANPVEELSQGRLVDGKIIDANHPDFLKHFFAHSRLHHLSSWKADLRLKFLKKIVKENKTKVNKLNKQIILHIDFDCFFATASCLNFPDLNINKDPIAVTHGGKTSDVASCNYVARSFGVRNGMWLGKAKELCPKLKTLPYDFEGYERHSTEFYNYLLSYDNFDSIFPVLIDEVLVDISSYCSDPKKDLAREVEDLCFKIRRDINNLTRCTVSIGASSNVLLAKLALKKAKPDNQFFLSEKISEFLSKIRVRDLPGIGNRIRDKLLAELPKTSREDPIIEDLLDFDQMKLMNIFGKKTGKKLFEYARGIDHTNIAIDTSSPESMLGRKSVSVDVNFGIRFDTVEQLEIFLMRLSKELYSRLMSLGVCGSNVTLRLAKRASGAPVNPEKYLGMGICEFINKSSRLGVATNDWGVIGSEVKALYRMINVPVKELRGIAITITRLEDVETFKKNRQSRLQFSKASLEDKKEIFHNFENDKPERITNSQNLHHIGEIESKGFNDHFDTRDGLNIDWDVFNSLPWDIKREIRQEFERRNLEPSDLRSSKNKTNKNLERNGKIFLQQLIPSQLGAPPKYVRVVEKVSRSPSKSPSKRQAPALASKLPTKMRKENTYDDSDSYSTTILNELPSSIRTEVVKDIEYRKKIKKFDLMPLRHKLTAKYEQLKPSVEIVTPEWLDRQTKWRPTPQFANNFTTFQQMKINIDNWIGASLQQKGPHKDDLSIFMSYISSLLDTGNLNRCLLLVEHIKNVLSFHEAANSCNKSLQEKAFIKEGIQDWWQHLYATIIPYVDSHQKSFRPQANCLRD